MRRSERRNNDSNRFIRELHSLIDENGGELVRNRKHAIYKFPDGRIFVQPQSVSDIRACRNALSDFRHFIEKKPQPIVAEQTVAIDVKPERRRMVIPNADPSGEDAGLIIYGGLRETTEKQEAPPSWSWQIGLNQFLDILVRTPSFWSLSPIGRTRVLDKIMTPRVQESHIIHMRSGKLDERTFKAITTPLAMFRSDREKVALADKLEMCLSPLAPAFYMTNGTHGLLVDCQTRSGNRIAMLRLRPEHALNRYAFARVIEGEHLIWVLNDGECRKTEEWLDPTKTRRVLREIDRRCAEVTVQELDLFADAEQDRKPNAP